MSKKKKKNTRRRSIVAPPTKRRRETDDRAIAASLLLVFSPNCFYHVSVISIARRGPSGSLGAPVLARRRVRQGRRGHRRLTDRRAEGESGRRRRRLVVDVGGVPLGQAAAWRLGFSRRGSRVGSSAAYFTFDRRASARSWHSTLEVDDTDTEGGDEYRAKCTHVSKSAERSLVWSRL